MSEQQAGVMRYVGTRPPRPDGVDKVSGRALFGADVSFGMVWGAVPQSAAMPALDRCRCRCGCRVLAR
jgi:hypothetical protein